MDKNIAGLIASSILLFTIVLLLLLIAYEDSVPFGLYKRLRCKLGKHSHHIKFGRTKIAKYYCTACKKPRNNPKLKLIDGGASKINYTKFKF